MDCLLIKGQRELFVILIMKRNHQLTVSNTIRIKIYSMFVKIENSINLTQVIIHCNKLALLSRIKLTASNSSANNKKITVLYRLRLVVK